MFFKLPIFGVIALLALEIGTRDRLSPYPFRGQENPNDLCLSENQHRDINGNGQAFSKAVTVNGADFQAIVKSRIRLPAVGEERDIGLGLRIKNTTKEPRDFGCKFGFILTTTDGKPLPTAEFRKNRLFS